MISVRGIYLLNGAVLLLLLTALMIILLKMHEAVPAIGVALGIISTAWIFVPQTLEYTWVCGLSLLACLIVISLSKRNKRTLYGLFFMITGMVTVYLDFLTTETLTLLLPLLILLWIGKNSGRSIATAAEAVISWGIGYVGMWVLKWVLAVLGILPFIRYLVLHNHSYLHYFFTYRALASTVLAIVLILGELTGFRAERRINAGKT